jgi:hypothetical protein
MNFVRASPARFRPSLFDRQRVRAKPLSSPGAGRRTPASVMRTPSSTKHRLDLVPPLADRFSLGFPIDYGPVLLLMPFGFPSRWTPCPARYCRKWL